MIYEREHDDLVNDSDVNMAIWGIFLHTTLRAAVYLGQDHDANFHYMNNNLGNSVELLFHETGKLISEQKEITGVSTVDFKDATWILTSLLCEKAYRITNAKTNVFSDSVLCVGKMGDDLVRKTITSTIESNRRHADEFEWKILPGIKTLGLLLQKIQSPMRDLQCKPEHFTDRIIFMSMYNDIEWGAKGNEARCEDISQTVADYARKFPRGHWSFLGAGSEKKWYGTYTNRPDGSWN